MKVVTRRVDLWQDNKLYELLKEARAIQKKLSRPSLNNRRQENKARNFADRMRQGKVSSALRVLNEEQPGGVLSLTRETIHLLKEKHSQTSDADGLRLQGCHFTPKSVIYEIITGEIIWKKSL